MSQTQSATTNAAPSEIAILGPVLSTGKDFTPPLARHLLGLGFSEEDNARINALAARTHEGTLAVRKREELQGYANAVCMLGILHAKARMALKKASRKQHSCDAVRDESLIDLVRKVPDAPARLYLLFKNEIGVRAGRTLLSSPPFASRGW